MCLKKITHNFYWKMRFLKQATSIRYVKAKLSKLVQISMLPHILRIFLQRIIWKSKRTWDKFTGHIFRRIFWLKNCFVIHINWPNSLPGCVYFSSYLIKCVSCFMLRHLMTSWHLNIWTVKTLPQEPKKLAKWNENIVVDTTFSIPKQPPGVFNKKRCS